MPGRKQENSPEGEHVCEEVVTGDIGCYTLGALPPYRAIESTLDTYSPHKLCTYLFELAQDFTATSRGVRMFFCMAQWWAFRARPCGSVSMR